MILWLIVVALSASVKVSGSLNPQVPAKLHNRAVDKVGAILFLNVPKFGDSTEKGKSVVQ